MAINNTLAKKQQKNDSQLMTYNANGHSVSLTPQTVRDYLVSGDKERVTMQEIVMFMNLCKFNNLNPWLREAYCIKYGSEPATLVVGKEAFEKRAEAHNQHDGHKAGVIVADESGKVDYRNGAFYLPGETIIGGWAEVYRKDHAESTRVEISFEEYAGRKKDGTLNRQWAAKPATMIRKVALVQALREAFPSTLGGMYVSEERGVDEPIDVTPITPPEIVAEAAPPAGTPAAAAGDPTAAFFGEQ